MTQDAARWAIASSAAFAALAGWPAARRGRWHAYWPVPVIAFALVVGGSDLLALLGWRPTDLTAPSLALGVWAAAVVTIAGVLEIDFCRRGAQDGRAFAAAALILAGGIAAMLHAAGSPPTGVATLIPGALVMVAGAGLAALRSLPAPAPALHFLWPAALLAGVFVTPVPVPRDPLAEARQEMEIVLAALRRAGTQVSPGTQTGGSSRFTPGPVHTFRADGNDVQIYLIAHDDDSGPEAHLSSRLAVPPPIGGVPHLHVGPHILVVCITPDPRFARQLDRLVHDLSDHRRQELFVFAMSTSR